jgi:hypothetical protein
MVEIRRITVPGQPRQKRLRPSPSNTHLNGKSCAQWCMPVILVTAGNVNEKHWGPGQPGPEPSLEPKWETLSPKSPKHKGLRSRSNSSVYLASMKFKFQYHQKKKWIYGPGTWTEPRLI